MIAGGFGFRRGILGSKLISATVMKITVMASTAAPRTPGPVVGSGRCDYGRKRGRRCAAHVNVLNFRVSDR